MENTQETVNTATSKQWDRGLRRGEFYFLDYTLHFLKK